MPQYPSINDKEFNLLKKIAENTAELSSGGGGGGGAGGLPMVGEAYIIVQTTDDPVANGTALLAAYAATKALTPNGAAISASNRATLLVPPGVYDFEGTPLDMDMAGVNVVGLSGHYLDVIFRSDGACEISAGNVLAKGISFRSRGTSDVPGLFIEADLLNIEMDSVSIDYSNEGSGDWQILVGIGGVDEANVFARNCDFDYDAIDGAIYGQIDLENVDIGQSRPGYGEFTNLRARTSFQVRPSNSTTNAAIVQKIAAGFANLDFGSILAGASADLTIAVVGAATGRSPCFLGFPSGGPEAGIVFQAWVSASDVVTVRATNITSLPIDPAAADYSVIVFRVLGPE